MIRRGRSFLVGLVATLGGCVPPAFAAEGSLPPSPPRVYPAVCEVPYDLAPGQRAVLLCAVRAPRGTTLEGIVVLESGHEAVDVSLVYSLHTSRHVFRLTNTSTTLTVRGLARGRVW